MHVDFFIFFLSPMAINPQQKNQKEWLICQKGLQHFKDTFEFFFSCLITHIAIFSKNMGLCGFKAVISLMMSIFVAETSRDSLKFYDPLRKSMKCQPCTF